ncbi:MAG: MucB/RseB C-terminal domain-containing protein [Burkholderiaceae bacterium]
MTAAFRASPWQRAGWLAALLGPLIAHPGAWAAPQGEPAQAPLDAMSWLARVKQAALTRNYQGTLVYTAAGVVSSSRVLHFCEGRQRYERIEVLDGEMRQVFRHNDTTQTLWPRSRVAVVEQRDATPDFPALPAGDGQALDSYELRVLGRERIAGHEAQVLLLKPRDAHRFAQRLWAEQGSGLLLRADTIGSKGEVLESAAFSDVTIGGKPQPDVVLAPMRKLEGYRVVRPAVAKTQLEAEGWTLARAVPGFQLVSCVKRPLTAAHEAATDASAQVLQAVFSDGMTHVSVFVEPYDAQRHKPMATSLGATHTWMQRAGSWWITAMGDVPIATVQLFAAALERRP